MPSKQPALRFQDIIDNIDRVGRHIVGMEFDQFIGDERAVDAVERCLQRISEAASKLGPVAEDLAPGEAWQDIRAMGNVLRHDYGDVSQRIIWDIAINRLPALRKACLDAQEAIERPR